MRILTIAILGLILAGCSRRHEAHANHNVQLNTGVHPAMVEPSKKQFRLRPDQMRPLATGYGGCIATDLITCDGHKVAFMYRESTEREADSGWRFMSGLEDDDYMSDPDNHGVYDVNTIANYDPELVPLLDAPVGSAFERENGTGPFVEVVDFGLSDE